MQKLSFRAILKELWNREVKVSTNKKDENIYFNGSNNLYPNEIERVINNSPIGVRAAQIMGKYIAGAGVTVGGVEVIRKDLPVVNRKQNLNISDILEIGARSIGYQNGVFLWRNIGLDDELKFKGNQLEVLDYKKCRTSKEDGDENHGKIWFRNWEISEDKKTNPARWFYPFSNNKDVILAQLKRDFEERYKRDADFGNDEDLAAAITCYRGQVMFLNLTPEFIYPLSKFDSAFNDLDTDFRISLYNNSNTRNGFLGKVIVQTQGLDTEEQEKVAKELQDWLGAENSGNMYLQNVEQTENLDLALKVTQVKPTFDEKLFTETDKRNRRNILGCANNLPTQLIYADDGALFSPGSDSLLQYKIFYSEQTQDERSALERAINQLGFEYGIIPIGVVIDDNTDAVDPVDDATRAAQATLKGSVGGVTALLEVQKSYSEGLTTLNSAIAILVNIFGFTEEVAYDLLGNPEKDIVPNDTTV